MSTTATAATIRLGVDLASLQTGLKQAATIAENQGQSIKAALLKSADQSSEAFKRLGASIGSALNPISLAMSALGTSASLAGLGTLITGAYEAADSMADLSIKTGVQVEQLSRFSTVAKLSGTDMDSVAGVLKKLSISAVDAYSGNEKLARSFDALGITTKELKTISPDELLIRIAQGIQGIDPMVVQDLMAQLGGKGATNVLPFLRELSERIDETSVKISTQFASDAKIFSDNLKLIEINVKSLGVSIASQLIPQYNILFDTIKNGQGVFSTIGEALKNDLAIMGVDFRKLPEEIQKAQTELETATGLEKASLERRLAVLKKHQSEVSSVLANNIDQNKTSKVQSAIATNNSAAGSNSGNTFLQGLQTRIEKADQGEYAMLRLQAAEKGVLAQADPLIAKLKELDIAKSVSGYEQSLALQNQELEFQQSLIGKIGLEKELLIAQHRSELDLAKQIEQIERARGPLSESTIAQMTNASQTAFEIQKNLISDRTNLERNFATGAQQSLAKYAEDATNYAGMAQSAFSNAFSSMETSLVSFIQTGKLDFNSLANSIIADLTRVMIRALIIGPIVKAIAGGGGDGSAGLVGTLMDFIGFENGGVFNKSPSLSAYSNTVQTSPKYFSYGTLNRFAQGGVFAEAGPEAVMPLKRDSQGRLGVISSQGNSSQISIVVNNTASDQVQVTANARSNEAGQQEIVFMIEKIVQNNIARNGSIAQTMANTYGLRRSVW